jgi:hypothetical protein
MLMFLFCSGKYYTYSYLVLITFTLIIEYSVLITCLNIVAGKEVIAARNSTRM